MRVSEIRVKRIRVNQGLGVSVAAESLDFLYSNFTKKHFQKVSIPHLTRTMKQKFLH